MSNAKYCLIYTRVSTTKQAQQGESSRDQEIVCRSVAERENLTVLKVFNEQFSGRKTDRPVMSEVLSYIKSSPKKIDVLIVRAIDRFTRGGTAAYETLKVELLKLNVQLIDSQGLIQQSKNSLEHLGVKYSWSVTSPSETAELVMAQQSKNEVSQILTRMIGAEISLVRGGYKVRSPNDGFLNKRIYDENGKKRTIQIPDPERAEYFATMFEMRACGSYSDQEIVNKLNEMGYRTKPRNQWASDNSQIIAQSGGKELTIKRLQLLIQNPIYCGVNAEKWLPVPIKTRYAGLVPIDIFNKANRGKIYIEELAGNEIKIHRNYSPLAVKRLRNNPDYPFKFVLCPYCKKSFTGSASKSKSGKYYPSYHCHRGHNYYGVPKEEFEKNILEFTENLKSNPEFMKAFEVCLISKFREEEKELGAVASKIGSEVLELEMRKKQKIEAYSNTQNKIIQDELEKQIEELHQQITDTRSKRNTLEIEEDDLHSFISFAKELMEHPKEFLMTQGDVNTTRALFGLVFDELPTYHQIISGTPKLSLLFKLSKESPLEIPNWCAYRDSNSN